MKDKIGQVLQLISNPIASLLPIHTHVHTQLFYFLSRWELEIRYCVHNVEIIWRSLFNVCYSTHNELKQSPMYLRLNVTLLGHDMVQQMTCKVQLRLPKASSIIHGSINEMCNQIEPELNMSAKVLLCHNQYSNTIIGRNLMTPNVYRQKLQTSTKIRLRGFDKRDYQFVRYTLWCRCNLGEAK